MAMQLEEEIMAKIGLGSHYGWYNGSGSCGDIRRQAARKLEEAISEAGVAGNKIASPNPRLIALVKEVATRGDKDEYVLTKTWQAVSDAIAAHIHAAANPGKEQEVFQRFAEDISKQYLDEPLKAAPLAGGRSSHPRIGGSGYGSSGGPGRSI